MKWVERFDRVKPSRAFFTSSTATRNMAASLDLVPEWLWWAGSSWQPVIEKKCNSEINLCGFQHQDLKVVWYHSMHSLSDQYNWSLPICNSISHIFREIFIKLSLRKKNIDKHYSPINLWFYKLFKINT